MKDFSEDSGTNEYLKVVFQVLHDKGLVTEEEYRRLLEKLLKRSC